LKGDEIFGEGIKDGIITYLVFGFKEGGEIKEKVTYTANQVPLMFFFCQSEEIQSVYDGNLKFEEVFSTKMFKKDDLVTKTGES
jgi:hypothetical protein